MSPVSTVTLKLLQTCSHSGGGTNNQVFTPESCACQDVLSTQSTCKIHDRSMENNLKISVEVNSSSPMIY